MLVALAATWGASFLFIKVGLEGLTPEQVVWGRLVLGAVALLLISAVTRSPLPRDLRVWGAPAGAGASAELPYVDRVHRARGAPVSRADHGGPSASRRRNLGLVAYSERRLASCIEMQEARSESSTPSHEVAWVYRHRPLNLRQASRTSTRCSRPLTRK